MRAPPVFLAAILLASFVAGCLGPGPTDLAPEPTEPVAAERWTPEAWKAALTEPRFASVLRTVHHITSFDGTRLSLTLYLPQGLGSDEKVPTLVQLTPYQSTNPQVGPLAAFFPDYVRHGVAYVEADARGTNASEGCLDFGGTADRRDAQIFAEWIRAQPWSNGRIVVEGVSHPGMGAVVAHAAIPGLSAAIPTAPVVSYYQDEWLQGAKFEDQLNAEGYQAIELLPSAEPSADAVKAQAALCTGKTLADFERPDGRFDAMWADRDLSRHTPAEPIPILTTHGFVDLNVHPDHFQLYWDALPQEYPKYAVLGYWYHGYPDMEGHPGGSGDDDRDFDSFLQRWFDATLLEVDNGLWLEPRVLVEDSKGAWHESHDWPLDGSAWVTLHAAADGTLGEAAPADGKASYTDRLGAVRGRWTDAHVAFRTEPLAAPTLVNGQPIVHLVASSSVDETKWAAYLLDEAPDGSWQRIAHGYADSHTWKDEAEWTPMVPGTAYAWDLKLLPGAVVVDAGHRIVLLIASQDSRNFQTPTEQIVCFDDYRGGCYDPSGIRPAATAGRAVNTVLTGPEGTRVDLALKNLPSGGEENHVGTN